MEKQVILNKSEFTNGLLFGSLIVSMLTELHFYAQLTGSVCSAVVGLYAVYKIVKGTPKTKKEVT